MKKIILLIVLAGFVCSGIAVADKNELSPQAVCPVMGGKIDKDVYVDYQAQRIYFCCPSCKEAFLKDPGKYMRKIADDKVLLESVQEICPVMGGKINKDIYVDYKGRRVFFCCESCKQSFSEDPGKYLKKLI